MKQLPGVLGKMADVIGNDAALKLGERYAGMEIKFPSRKTLDQPTRDERIMEDFIGCGMSVSEIARKHNLTKRRIYQVIKDNSAQ
jgi:Mor family transcriptional regulator